MTNVNSFNIKTEPEENTYNVNFEGKSFVPSTKLEPVALPSDKNHVNHRNSCSDLNNNGPCYDSCRYDYNHNLNHQRHPFVYDKTNKYAKKGQYFYCYGKFYLYIIIDVCMLLGVSQYLEIPEDRLKEAPIG